MVGLVQGMLGLVTGLPCYNRDLQVDMVRLVMGLVMGLVRFHSYLVKYMIINKCFYFIFPTTEYYVVTCII